MICFESLLIMNMEYAGEDLHYKCCGACLHSQILSDRNLSPLHTSLSVFLSLCLYSRPSVSVFPPSGQCARRLSTAVVPDSAASVLSQHTIASPSLTLVAGKAWGRSWGGGGGGGERVVAGGPCDGAQSTRPASNRKVVEENVLERTGWKQKTGGVP